MPNAVVAASSTRRIPAAASTCAGSSTSSRADGEDARQPVRHGEPRGGGDVLDVHELPLPDRATDRQQAGRLEVPGHERVDPRADHRGRTQHRDERSLAAPCALQHRLGRQQVTDEALASSLVGARERVGVVDDGTVRPRAVHDGGPDRDDVPGTDGPRRAQDTLRVRDDGRLALATPLDRGGDKVAGVGDEHDDACAGDRVLRALGRQLVDRADLPAPRGGDR